MLHSVNATRQIAKHVNLLDYLPALSKMEFLLQSIGTKFLKPVGLDSLVIGISEAIMLVVMAECSKENG